MFEDGAAIFYEVCEYREVTGTYTDHKRDETYCETGPRCGEKRYIRCNVQKIKVEDDWISVQEYWDEDAELSQEKVAMLEDVEFEIYDSDNLTFHEIDPPHHVDVSDESEQYRAVYKSGEVL